MSAGFGSWDVSVDDMEPQHPYRHLIQPQLSANERRKLQNRLAQRKFRQKKSQQSKSQQQGSSDEATPRSAADASPAHSYSHTTNTSDGSLGNVVDYLPEMTSYHHHSITPPYSGYQQVLRNRAGSLDIGSDPSDPLAMFTTPAVSPGADLGPSVVESPYFSHGQVSTSTSTLSHISVSPVPSTRTATHSRATSRSGTNSPRYSMSHSGWPETSPCVRGAPTVPEQYMGAAPGRPLLHVAAQKGHGSVLQILIDHNVDINERDTNGATALHLAVENGHEATARLLLQHGADMNACDSYGRSPVYLAVSLGHEDVVRMFLLHGADPRLRVHGS